MSDAPPFLIILFLLLVGGTWVRACGMMGDIERIADRLDKGVPCACASAPP